MGIHIGGRGQKRWPVEHFGSLAGRLIENHDAKVVIFWGPGEKELLKAITEEDPPLVHEANPEVPRELSAVIRRAHEQDRSDRFATAELRAWSTPAAPQAAWGASHRRCDR